MDLKVLDEVCAVDELFLFFFSVGFLVGLEVGGGFVAGFWIIFLGGGPFSKDGVSRYLESPGPKTPKNLDFKPT